VECLGSIVCLYGIFEGRWEGWSGVNNVEVDDTIALLGRWVVMG